MVSTLEQLQVQNGTGPGVRRSKRPLLASHTRCRCHMETSRNKVVTSKTVIRSSSATRSRLSELSDQWRVFVIMSQSVMLYLGEWDFIMFD